MIFVSLTRLRLRSVRLLPSFLFHLFLTVRQIKRSPGFQKGALLSDRRLTFWTLTAWDSVESMRQYITTGSHKAVMPYLLDWCDEASVAHWSQLDTKLPSWLEAGTRMRNDGRASKVRDPSPHHASLLFTSPRTIASVKIRPS
ncbi:hypothetical protein AciPR4_2269 [Terriglobus saanensis SP1PR4]|uniref:DUF3291 domain-containing protein n=1 Tax=Terriglobus saanensis (strain ATCC BAA-1853 / DSM 23119 / SP1PR4) TaxID=401053 RepID=E8UXA7_TERSS|nr:hypothetical protein AciPR4_2269 [Terriglobus saanensis SP1PR4]